MRGGWVVRPQPSRLGLVPPRRKLGGKLLGRVWVAGPPKRQWVR